MIHTRSDGPVVARHTGVGGFLSVQLYGSGVYSMRCGSCARLSRNAQVRDQRMGWSCSTDDIHLHIGGQTRSEALVEPLIQVVRNCVSLCGGFRHPPAIVRVALR